jgi:hypothetical protein
LIRKKYQAAICLSLEEVAVHYGLEVLMEIDDNNALTVDGPQGILDQQLSPRSIYSLCIIITYFIMVLNTY